MTATTASPVLEREKPAPSRNLPWERLGHEPVPQEPQPAASLLGSIVGGTALIAFAAAALTLVLLVLTPAVFVVLLLVLLALAPVILLGLALVSMEDLQRYGETDARRVPGVPGPWHRDHAHV